MLNNQKSVTRKRLLLLLLLGVCVTTPMFAQGAGAITDAANSIKSYDDWRYCRSYWRFTYLQQVDEWRPRHQQGNPRLGRCLFVPHLSAYLRRSFLWFELKTKNCLAYGILPVQGA